MGYAVEGWRLVRVAVIVLGIVLIIQYFELPYGNVLLSSKHFSGKTDIASSTDNSSNTLHTTKSSLDYVNLTSSIAIDSTNSTANDSELSDGKDVFPEDELPSNDTTVDTGQKNHRLKPIDTKAYDIQERDSGNAGEVFEPNSTSLVRSFETNSTNQINEHPVLDNFTLRCIPGEKKDTGCPKDTVMSLSEMNVMMLHSLVSSQSTKPKWSSSADQELLKAKSIIVNSPDDLKVDAKLYAPLYRNISMFYRSYSLMEETLKVYIYKEGEKPIFHQPFLKGIYASEGWFMKLLKNNKNFITKNPKKAQLFYLPFSSRMLEETLYVPNSHSHKNLIKYLNDYLTLISSRYPFWNRTNGADHFLVACHDWAPSETWRIMESSIRSLCNADVTGGFKFGKDVSLPETYIKTAKNPLRQLGGEPASRRKILAFFAGNMHGYLRPLLLEYWENKDKKDMKIFGQMGKKDYIHHMRSSKYCICARGYEVNSPRVVEAIFYGCIPVMISDNFVPPFFESLNWEEFAVFVAEKEVPNLRKILVSISDDKYLEMQRRVKMVQQHFLWHPKPVKYDAFHMIIHSIWFTRVFQMTKR